MSFTPSDPTDDFNKQFKSAQNSFQAATIAVIVVSILGAIGTIFAIILIYKYCKKHGPPALNINYNNTPPQHHSQPYTTVRDSQIMLATVENFLENIAKEKPIRFTPEQLQNFTDNYAKKLGSGGFGSVYKGSLPNGVPIAVKKLSTNIDRRLLEEQFMAEVGTIGRTYHINLVRLYGFSFNEDVRALVYEYMENGSLDKHLFDTNRAISWETLHDIAVGTAKGIRYLHEECEQRIIHYDIKPGNILLDREFNPKVADFGLAKLMNREMTHVSMPGGRGTPGYAAPEMWMPSPVTYKCDVYSFGMLLFEIVGRRRNLDLTRNESQEWFPKHVYDKFANGNLTEIVALCGIGDGERERCERMCKVALWCVQYSPEARPPMSKVVKMLEGEMEISAPMNPFQHLFASNSAYSDLWRDESSRQSRVEDTTPVMRQYEIEIATSK